MTVVTLVVEGDTDVPFAKKILAAAGLRAELILDKGGKSGIDANIAGYNHAARFSPWFVLRDLDHDAACAPALVSLMLPEPEPLMCLRIPVRAVESWALGDAERLAAF